MNPVSRIMSPVRGETKMKFGRMYGAVLLLATAAPAAAAGETVSFSGDSAILYGDDGAPVLRGSKDYVLAFAENPEGRAINYDADHRMVRLSPADKPGLWVSCKDVIPVGDLCAEATVTKSPRGASRGGGGAGKPETSAIPSCPGDPRCPGLP
jgi:hypothetical protein